MRATSIFKFLGIVYLFFSLPFSSHAFTLDKNISGSVKDEGRRPLVGATIRILGTIQGTMTNDKGEFELPIPEDANTLIISYFGYISKTIEIEDRNTLEVVLAASSSYLDRVVAVGYGTQKKNYLASSLSSISSLDFEGLALRRLEQIIQGRAAGVSASHTSGAPGAGYKIRVRGPNSIYGSNHPLYVLDGLVIGDISSIDINDIESIEILKDASSMAIYGSRGSNGVILITTKTGKKENSAIKFNSFFGTSQISRKLDMLSPAEFAEGVNVEEGSEIFTTREISALRDRGGEDWQERLFRRATFSNYHISSSGREKKTDYYISGNFQNENGTIVNQDYKRYAIRANMNSELSNRLTVGLNMFGSREELTGVSASLATGLTWDPTTPAFTPRGEYNIRPIKPKLGNTSVNPLIAPENNARLILDHEVIARGYFDLDLWDGLSVNISGGVERLNRTNNSYTSILVNNIGYARVIDQEVARYQNTNRISYVRAVTRDHQFQIDAIHEQQLTTNIYTISTGTGFFSDKTTYQNLGLAANQSIRNVSRKASIQSYLGRIQYTLMQKIFLTASVRTDGSSKFRKGNRWGSFPAGAIAWRISEENFMQTNHAISNLKIRMGYGVTGNHGVNTLGTQSFSFTDTRDGTLGIDYPFGGTTATVGIAPTTRLANPDLTWEKTTQTNIGLDLGLWNSKLNLSIDIFSKRSKDLLVNVFLPQFLGPTVMYQNLGEVKGKGFDINLGFSPIRSEDWKITSILTVSRFINTVVSLPDDKPIARGTHYGLYRSVPVYPTRVEVGQAISSFRGYVFEGVYQTSEAEAASEYGRVPGDAKYRDINKDGKISEEDITTIGDGNPDFTWGLSNKVSYKDFDLNFLLIGSHGGEIYNLQRGRMMGLGYYQYHATHGDYRDRWTPTNPSNIPAGRENTELLSSQFIENGSYVSMKVFSLSYTISNAWDAIGLGDVRLSLNTENLFILSKYTGYGPESTITGYSDVDVKIDYNSYPLARSFSVGVNMSF